MHDAPFRVPLALEITLVAALTLIAFYLRANNLAEIPKGINGDEANIALEVQRILREGWIGFWSPINLGTPSFDFYLVVPYFLLGGHKIEMVRLSYAVLGSATVPLAYIALRQLFGIRIALTAAAMLVFCVWHLIQSRIGWDPASYIFVYALAVALLVTGLRSKRLWLVALAGAVFGLGLYTYKAFLIIYIFSAAATVGLIALQPSLIRKREIYWFFGVSLLVGAPILYFYAFSFDVFQHVNVSYGDDASLTPFSSSTIPTLLNRFWDVLMYTHANNFAVGSEGAGGTPVFTLPIAAAMFWLGLLASILFVDKPAYRLLLIGWLVAMLPAILVPGMESRRYLLGVMFMLPIASVGLHALLQLAIAPLSRYDAYWKFARLAIPSAAAIFIALFAMNNLREYDHFAHHQSLWYFNNEYAAACEYVKSFNDEYHVRFYSNRVGFDHSVGQFLLPDTDFINASTQFGGDGTATYGGDIERDTLFILIHEYLREDLQADISSAYPGGHWHHPTGENGETLFAAYIIDLP